MTSFICDICKIEYTDEMEIQEALFIDTICGYSSIFGDGEKIQCDICQYCLRDKLGAFLRRL